MTTTTNRHGKNITVGQKCIITKQFSNMKIETTVTKISTRFVYANGQKFCINNLNRGSIGNVSYIELIEEKTKQYIELTDEWNDGRLFESIATRLGHLNNNGLETMLEFGNRYYCDDLQDVKDLTDICKVINISFTTGTEVLT